MKKRDVREWPVMAEQCPTCPLRVDERGRYPDPRLAAEVMERCITRASQICHHPRLHGRPETHLGRRARDYQLMIFYRLGVLKETNVKDLTKPRGIQNILKFWKEKTPQ